VRHHATALPAPILQPLVRSYIGYQYLGLDPGSHLGLPSPDLTVILSLGPPTRLDVMPDASQGPAEFIALAGGLHSTPAVIGHDGDLYGIELDILVSTRILNANVAVPDAQRCQTSVGVLSSALMKLPHFFAAPAGRH
jgi:hypothetical protein